MAIDKIEKRMQGGVSVEVTVINGRNTYTLADIQKLGSFSLRLDGELIIPNGIKTGVTLLIETKHSIVVKGDIYGTICVTNYEKEKKIELSIQGAVKTGGGVHTYSNVNCTVTGEVEPAAKIIGKEKIVCQDIVCDTAILKAKDITFNAYVDIKAYVNAENITVDARFYDAIKKKPINFKYKTISYFSEKLEIIDADTLEADDLTGEWLQLASIIEQGKEYSEEKSNNESNDNQIEQNSKKVEFGPRKTAKPNLNKRKATSMENGLAVTKPTFLNRKTELIQRMSDFYQELLKNKKLVTSNGNTIEPFEHQMNDLLSLIKHYKEGKFNGHLKNATGTGKTLEILLFFIAMNTCKNLRVMDVPLLIIVSRTSLIKQTIEEFIKYYPGLNIGVVDGSHKKIGTHVTITTYPSFEIQMDKKAGDSDKILYPEKFGFFVFDEAHHLCAKGVHPKIPQLYTHGPILGVSATTERNTNLEPGALRSVGEVLPTCYGRFEITTAIEKGVLAPVHNAIVHVHTSTNIQSLRRNGKVSKYFNPEQMRGFSDFRDEELAPILNVKKINNIIVQLLSNGVFLGKRALQYRVLVSAAGVLHARQIAAEINHHLENLPEFKGKGIKPAEVVYSGMSPSEEERISHEHGIGLIAVVCFCEKWSEGVNFPQDAILINARPIADPGGSIVTAQQRGGRMLRKAQDKVALIIDLVYGVPQITFNRFLNGKYTYGKIPQFESQAYSTENLIHFSEDEVESYRVDSEYFFVAKAVVPKPTLETAVCETKTTIIATMEQPPEEDDAYLYNIPELNLEITSTVQQTRVPVRLLEEGEIPETNETTVAESEVTNRPCSMFQLPKRHRTDTTTTTYQEDYENRLGN